jgi:hypothetical protein
MKLLLTTVALVATLASPAFAQNPERAAMRAFNEAPKTHVQHAARGRNVLVPGESESAFRASQDLIRQDELKDCYIDDRCMW